jgi:riboflavin biosynthesis pyrimidine reductase
VFEDGEARTVQVTLPGMPAVGESWEIPAGEGNRPDLAAFLVRGSREGWRHVLVEGGAAVFTAFLRTGLVDALHLHLAPRVLGDDGSLSWAGSLGVSTLADARSFRLVSATERGGDLVCVLERHPSPGAPASDDHEAKAVGVCSPE